MCCLAFVFRGFGYVSVFCCALALNWRWYRFGCMGFICVFYLDCICKPIRWTFVREIYSYSILMAYQLIQLETP
jgi:uncharacterized membrane protein YqjE